MRRQCLLNAALNRDAVLVSFEHPAARRLTAAVTVSGSDNDANGETMTAAVDPQLEREALSLAISSSLPGHLLEMLHYVEVLEPKVDVPADQLTSDPAHRVLASEPRHGLRTLLSSPSIGSRDGGDASAELATAHSGLTATTGGTSQPPSGM